MSVGNVLRPLFVSERLLSGRKVVLRPERLTAHFQQVNGTLLTTLRWRMSQHALDPAAVEGFQFTWTLQSGVTTATEGQEDTLISQTQTIAPVRHEERSTVPAMRCEIWEGCVCVCVCVCVWLESTLRASWLIHACRPGWVWNMSLKERS